MNNRIYDEASKRYKENGKYAENMPCDMCGSKEGMGHDDFEILGDGRCVCWKCFEKTMDEPK